MKKFLSLMLTVAMIITLITIPTSVAAADTFNGDFAAGDRVFTSFDASDDNDLAKAYVEAAADGTTGKVETFVAGGDKYAYASGGNKWLNFPMNPGFLTGKNLYIKFRIFATTDVPSGDKSAYFYFANTHRLPKSLENSLYQSADASLSLKAAGPGMDNIYEISETGAWTLYARQVGSDGPWIKITTGQTAAHYNAARFMAQSGLGISSIIVYSKQDPEPEISASFCEGDKLIASFDASNAEDMAKIASSDGVVETMKIAGETYAYTSKVSAGSMLRVPQILPVLSENESVYVRMRLHAAFDNTSGKTVYVWTNNSGNARAGFNMGEGLTNLANNCLASAAGVDVILDMKGEGFDVYTRTVGSGEWALDHINKEYQSRTGENSLNIYYGLAIASAKVYKKLPVEIRTVNAAKDADAMSDALTTYATALGIDLTKLDKVNDDAAVFAEMIGTYEKAEEIAAAFNAAVQKQRMAEFNGDYVAGDRIFNSFDASNDADLKKAYVLDGSDGSKGSVLTFTSGGDTYAYASGGDKWIQIPMCPGFRDDDFLYIKLTTHATTDVPSGDKSAYFYFGNTHRLAKSLEQSLYQAADSSLTLTSGGPGMENIFEIAPDGKWTLYAKQVGSDGLWTEIFSGATAAHTNNKTFMAQSGLGISDILVYTKQAPEIEAVNKATTAEEMGAALLANATALGVDLTNLEKVEDDNAVYAAMVGTVYTSAEDVVNAFNAAISAQVNAEFDGDFVDGDKIVSSFDASNEADLAKLISTNGEVATETFAGETFAYTTKTDNSSTLKLPQILPAIPSKGPIYVKLRFHAAFDNTTGKTVYVYTKNSAGKRVGFNMLETVTNKANNCSPNNAGVDVIIKMSEDGYDLYSKAVGSDVWSKDLSNNVYQNNSGDSMLNVYYGLAISSAKVYKKLPDDEMAITLNKDAVTVRNYESGAIVLASYASEGGKMIDCEVITDGIVADTAISISDKLNTNGATVVKAFLLKDMTTLEPICESKSAALN